MSTITQQQNTGNHDFMFASVAMEIATIKEGEIFFYQRQSLSAGVNVA